MEARQLLAAVPVISEFLAINNSGLSDEDGDNSDWIELHNAGDESFDLTGWYWVNSGALTGTATLYHRPC